MKQKEREREKQRDRWGKRAIQGVRDGDYWEGVEIKNILFEEKPPLQVLLDKLISLSQDSILVWSLYLHDWQF